MAAGQPYHRALCRRAQWLLQFFILKHHHSARRACAMGRAMNGLNDLIPLMVELLWALIVVAVVLSIAAVIVGCAS